MLTGSGGFASPGAAAPGAAAPGAARPAAVAPAEDAPTVVAGPANAPSSDAVFFVKSGPEQGSLLPIGNLVTLGRAAGCEIRLADPHVSARHARIKREGATYVYLDLESSNGSFLRVGGREERLRAAYTLDDNDEIRVGETILQFLRTPHGGER